MSDALAAETLICLILVAMFLLSSVILQKLSEINILFRLVHESGICILLGILSGLIFTLASGSTPSKFETSLFFHFMLPFLIFGQGYNMKRRRFFRNIGVIILNGVLGTLINFILISACAWGFSNTSKIQGELSSVSTFTIKDSLILGAVLSSTETVVTLSILRENKTPRLNSIMFGEFIIGTAISIILVNTISDSDFDEFTTINFFLFLGYFLYNLVLSVVLGLILGFLSSFMTKNLIQIKNNPSKEVALQFYVGWTGYLIAAILDCSGIITILITAIISSHYAYYNMNPDSRIVVSDTFYLLGDGTRALIFAYLGLTALSYDVGDISFLFMFLMLLAILVCRFATVFGLAAIRHFANKKHRFDFKDCAVVWVGGLFRGTIAFALIISIDIENKEMLQVTVLYIVIFSMLVYGAILPWWVLFVSPKETIIENHSILEAVADGDYRKSYFGNNKVTMLLAEDFKRKRNWVHRAWRDFDSKYLKPLLINKESLEEQKKLKLELERKANPEEAEIEIEDSKHMALLREKTVEFEESKYEHNPLDDD